MQTRLRGVKVLATNKMRMAWPLTIVLDLDGLTGLEDGKHLRTPALRRRVEGVLDLVANEARTIARVGRDVEGVGRDRAQGTARIFE